ncbi:hypothetical protein D3C76_829770 [compost metagenome]
MEIVEQQMQLPFDIFGGMGDQGNQGVDRLLAAVTVEPILFDRDAQALQGRQ